jgi:hypothetical protein
MNKRPIDRSIRLILAAILLGGSRIASAGTSPLATDDKEYSTEPIPLEKSWCKEV